MKSNNKFYFKLIIGAFIFVIVSVSCGLVVCNYVEQQKIVEAEQARIAEEEALAEQIRIAELEAAKTNALLYLEEQKESVIDYLTDENIEELDSIQTEIELLESQDSITSIIEKIDAIIIQATEAKEAAEEAAAKAASESNKYQQEQTNIYAEKEWYESQPQPTFGEYEAKEQIAWYESRGCYEAQNGQYWGRYQLSSGWFSGYDIDYILYTEEGHAIQEQQAEAYVAGRYGSWMNAYYFWQSHGWY